MAREPKIVPFGKYELLEKIAVGGMAEIFKARTKGVGGFEKYLAIKRILPHLSENKDFIDMLINEAKIAVMLSHANIVQIYDLGKIDDSYFIAMEYIEGKDLRALMTRCDQIGMPLFIQHAIFICIEVCKGLEYAHAKTDQSAAGPRDLNIVHRDISPQNIMISYEGEVKITDFGIAKANVNISETEAGVVKGKYEYMSPEQASGLAVDRRTDIFSTGIVLYEMLTGQKPFRGESDLTILERVREAKVDPPSKYNKSIPKKLEKIVLKSLARDPVDRYQTSTELKDDLTRFFYSSTFNFTTSNLAAFMKSIFAEEIKLDVLTDADGGTGINKRPNLDDDGRTLSRIFGKGTSEKFAAKARNGGVLGAVTTDTSSSSGRTEGSLSRTGTDADVPTDSRTLGGEALANIEEEINRILIPGKTNVGRFPTAAPGTAASISGRGDGMTGSTVPKEETGSRRTVAAPRPTNAVSALLGGDVQSAAMELAMELDVALPPIGGTNTGRTPAPSAESEPETAAGQGSSGLWNGDTDDPLESNPSVDDADDRPTRERAAPALGGTNGRSTFSVDVDAKEEPGTAASSTESKTSTPRESTIITSRPSSAPAASPASRPSIASASPTASKAKVPIRAVKERVRGVTVNAPMPPIEDDELPPGEGSGSWSPSQEPATGSATSSGESTVIGRKPLEDPIPMPSRGQASISRTLSRNAPSEDHDDSTGSSSVPRATRLGPTTDRDQGGSDREGERTFVGRGGSRSGTASVTLDEPGSEFEPEVFKPEASAPVPARRPARTAAARSDDQSELYPAVGPGKARRVALPLPLLIFIMAVIFLAGVLLSEML